MALRSRPDTVVVNVPFQLNRPADPVKTASAELFDAAREQVQSVPV
jgi:hypothetical protein